MVTVFTSFVLSDDPTVKMLAVGMAGAVLIDATVVRMILVSAAMSLLGDAAWWIPRWLDWVLPALELEGLAAPTCQAARARRAAPAGRSGQADRAGARPGTALSPTPRTPRPLWAPRTAGIWPIRPAW